MAEELEIRASKGAVKKRTRRGRGNASGLGGECGRGHKGQKSRSGFKSKPGFEGGQTPLYRRIPKKRGIHNPFRIEYAPINLGTLEATFNDGDDVTKEALIEKGLVRSKDRVKILAEGELKKKLVVHGDKISQNALAKIEKSGSTYQAIAA
ncbi:MAG: large subunit ribosomal protein L15 [Candidatus Marinamargulisbacteria bacterium]|jgi:large subunit ribosomal protein L15